jgi:hypothetical protein
MSTRSTLIALISLGLVAAGPRLHAEGNAIKGSVKGSDGKLMANAEVQVQAIDKNGHGKGPLVSATTNSKGEYSFRGLNSGTYKVVAVINKVPKSQAAIATKTTGWVRVDFDLTAKKTAGKKRMVWVAGETGTHIGGGHWEAVDDTNTGEHASSMERVSGSILNTPGQGLSGNNAATGPGH